MSTLPEWYKKWIPRVSDVVSYIYPFEWESKTRYQQWLNKVGVKEEDYLNKAQVVWTYVHQFMEDYLNWVDSVCIDEYNNQVVDDTIVKWKQYIRSLYNKYKKEDWREYEAEPILVDNKERYQGSSDLVLTNKKTNKAVIIDWKSFWISKSFFGLDNKYKKPYDKIKKGRLQFSLYAEVYRQKWYEIEDIILVYLHDSWAYEYKLELYSSEELDKILTEFTASKEEAPIIITKTHWGMIIELRKPTETYWYINITIDMYKETDGKTAEQKIDEAKALIKYTLTK